MTKKPENNGTPAGAPFGDTDLGSALGCATIILAIGLSIAIYAWAAR
jgi:hypothetical protein